MITKRKKLISDSVRQVFFVGLGAYSQSLMNDMLHLALSDDELLDIVHLLTFLNHAVICELADRLVEKGMTTENAIASFMAASFKYDFLERVSQMAKLKSPD